MSLQTESSPEKYKNNGLSGLSNVGNTCYLNSCMQLFSHTYELNDFLNSGKYKERLNNVPDSVVIVEWDKLREMMWSSNCTIAPWGFVKSIKNIAKQKGRELFTGYSQNDMQEFFLFILDCFHNSIRREVNMEITGDVENTTDKLAIECYKMMKNMYKNDYSEILNIFYGIHISEIVSTNGNDTLSVRPEPFSVLSVPIPQKKNINIYDCINEYCKEEVMSGDNAWYNDKTSKYQDVTRQISFWSLPNVLIIDLKRWSTSGNKKQNLVTTPLTDLDLSKYVKGYNKNSYVYDLYGVANHSGGSSGGHYTAYVKNANGLWYEFNDTNINEIKSERVVSTKSYCFFFRKKK